MNCLEQNTVLVLNKNWQPINVTNPFVAITMLFCSTAYGIKFETDGEFFPIDWKEWKERSVHSSNYINTSSGFVEIPKVILLRTTSDVPKFKPKFTIKNLWERDKGVCQYTGKKLTYSNGNIDHVIPKSRGGKTSWTNCVLSHKTVNSLKANKTPGEAGLILKNNPKEPSLLPVSLYIKNTHSIKEWDLFLYK